MIVQSVHQAEMLILKAFIDDISLSTSSCLAIWTLSLSESFDHPHVYMSKKSTSETKGGSSTT